MASSGPAFTATESSGAGDYLVQQGDSLSSIAFRFGMNWQALWNHPGNAGLKSTRKNPNVLYPGDIVCIPKKAPRTETCSTDARYRFVRKATPDKLKIRLLDDFEPRAHLPYTLVVDGNTTSGSTDGAGRIEEWISPGAKEVRLILDSGEEYPFDLGHIDPIDTVTGLQGRLHNLRFLDEITGEMDEATKSALRAFQKANGLRQTGEPDRDTQSKLIAWYGC